MSRRKEIAVFDKESKTIRYIVPVKFVSSLVVWVDSDYPVVMGLTN